jgi:ElaB/YqjD/DUF883 family membrane-anchored ribosome-binding protein
VRADQCAIDVGGLGAGVYDRVAEIVSSPEWDGPPCEIVQVNSSESPIDAKKYTNKRAEMWGETKEWLEKQPAQIPDSDELQADLTQIKYSYDSNNALKMEKKEDMKKRGFRSPDMADALGLTSPSLTLMDMLKAQGVSVEGERESRTYKVKKELVTGTDVLEEEPWLGKYIPLVPMYGEEVNVNGKRYFKSLHRDAHDSQKAYNYLRTTGIELIGLTPKAPYVGPKGAFNTDANKWDTINTTAHGFVEYDGQIPPQRQQLDASAAGILREAMSAHDDVKAVLGMFDASIGNRSNETSGKAIMARQREGDTGTFHFLDNRNRAIEHGGRIVMDLIPHYYTTERILRCVQEDGESYTVPLGVPVAHKSQLEALLSPQQPQGQAPQGQAPQTHDGAPAPQGPPQYVPVPPQVQAQLSPEQARQLAAITKVFDLTVGKYGVAIQAGPNFTTRRQEAAEQMMEFIRIFPQAAGYIGDLLAKNLDWPGSEQVAERLKAMLPPQAQGNIDPMVQQLQQTLQQQGQQAQQTIAQLQKQIGELTQKVNDKSAQNHIDAHKADTDRIEALADAFSKGLHVSIAADGSINGQPLVPPGAMQGGFAGMPPQGAMPGMMPMAPPQQQPGMPKGPVPGMPQ